MERTCEVCLGQDFIFLFRLDHVPGSYSQCRRCGLVRVDETRAYDYTAEEYIETLGRQAMSADRLHQWTIKRIEQHHVPGTMVEVGCSTGTQLAVAKKHGWRVLGFDVNPDCPPIAWHLHRVEVRCENFLELQERSIADVILMSQLIDLVPDPRPFLQRSLHMLKLGGLVVLTAVNWNFAAPFAWMAAHLRTPIPTMDHFGREHVRLYSPRTMHVLAEQLGWRVRAIYDNPTDYVGNRGIFSARKLVGNAGRLVALATRQRHLIGMNMLVILEPLTPAG